MKIICDFVSCLTLCFLGADRRSSGHTDPESHEKLAQRIEKDVVSVLVHTVFLFVCFLQ